ncbi:MAG TPA: hypothetical protein VMC05_15025 [Xanthobacteraceae bacterium]|nr:hypothetical protein [Xanthobacteraceae bacterium]
MPSKLIAALIIAALPLAAAAPAAAQNPASPTAQPGFASPPAPRHVRGRITIHPGRLLYRRCVDWYELQHRPSGTVLFPEMRCWWVRG